MSNVKCGTWNKTSWEPLIHAFIALCRQYLQMTSTDSHTILTSVWCHVSSPSWGLRSRWETLGLMLGDMDQRGWVPICLSGVNQDVEMWGWRGWNRCDEMLGGQQEPNRTERNLGVMFEDHLSFTTHISTMVVLKSARAWGNDQIWSSVSLVLSLVTYSIYFFLSQTHKYDHFSTGTLY